MNVAILLTVARLFLAPAFAYTFITAYNNNLAAGWLWAAFTLGALIELTDAFDGMVARRSGKVTDLGKVFDPAADSLSRLTAFISFMVVGIVPLWMFLVFMYRDMLMSLLRIICASKGTVLAARKSGKLKAVLQGIAIGLVVVLTLLQAYEVIPRDLQWMGRHPGYWIVGFAAAFTALSLLDYVIPNWAKIKAMTKTRD